MLGGRLKYLLLLLLVIAGTAAAETIYVNDYLRLGIRDNPNSSESPLAVVTTGESLEVLERRGGYIRIRSEDGVEGWVSKAYVSSEPPARLRLERLQQEHARQLQRIEELQKKLTNALQHNDELKGSLTDLMDKNAELRSDVSNLQSEARQRAGEYFWLYRALAIIGIFLLGIILGVYWYKQRVAERLGGLEL